MDKEQKDPARKQLIHLRLQTLMIGLILLLILLFVLFLMSRVNDAMAIVNQLDVAQLNGAVGSLKSAADKLSAVDMEGLNTAISSLSDTAGNLSQLDFEKLGNFLDSLDGLSSQMDVLTDFFSKFIRK